MRSLFGENSGVDPDGSQKSVANCLPSAESKAKMNKIIIAPDSFKGSLTSAQVTETISKEIQTAFPDCNIIEMPIADGGEGSVDTIISVLGGAIHKSNVLSPDDRTIEANYGIATNGTAVLEMAQSSGITRQKNLNPMTSTTFGFGELIKAALGKGAREFVLCIGGSATTDGGCGMAAALGVEFFDSKGNKFIPSGETLSEIAKIDTKNLDKRIAECKFTVMCDVDNPLFGERGAAYIYSPQKGATPAQVLILDSGLQHFGEKLSEHFGREFYNIPGAGAAGGLGAGCLAFLGANLMSGIEAILNLCNFAKQSKDADLIITGEGKLDEQSFQGKVLSGIRKNSGNVPIWSICGVCDYDKKTLKNEGISVFETSEGISKEESMKNPEKYIKAAVQRAIAAQR